MMMRLLSLCLLFAPLIGFSQPFQPDACGVVKDTAFQTFCKKKGYVLVGAFRGNPDYNQLVADVYDGSTWRYLGVDGNEAQKQPRVEVEEILEESYWPEENANKKRTPVTDNFSKNGKLGYTYLDKVILPAIYDSIVRIDQCGLFFLKVEQKGRWGVANNQGKLIIPANFDEITPAVGAFICKNQGGYTAFTRSGKEFFTAKSRIWEGNPGIFSWYDETEARHITDIYGNQTTIVQGGCREKDDVLDEWADAQAEFPGGLVALMKFLQENLQYPLLDGSYYMTGKVYLKFIVQKNGKISQIEIMRGIADCPECGKEAIRVVSIMPDWIPATLSGRPVASYFHLPIKFEPRL